MVLEKTFFKVSPLQVYGDYCYPGRGQFRPHGRDWQALSMRPLGITTN